DAAFEDGAAAVGVRGIQLQRARAGLGKRAEATNWPTAERERAGGVADGDAAWADARRIDRDGADGGVAEEHVVAGHERGRAAGDREVRRAGVKGVGRVASVKDVAANE